MYSSVEPCRVHGEEDTTPVDLYKHVVVVTVAIDPGVRSRTAMVNRGKETDNDRRSRYSDVFWGRLGNICFSRSVLLLLFQGGNAKEEAYQAAKQVKTKEQIASVNKTRW